MLPKRRVSMLRAGARPGGWLILVYVLLAVVTLLGLGGVGFLLAAGGDWIGLGYLAVAILSAALGALFYRRQHSETAQARALLELKEGFSSKLELDDLVADIGRTASHLVAHADECVLHLLDESKRRLLPRYSSQPDWELPFGMPADRGIAGEALRTSRTIRVADVRSEPHFLPLHSGPELRSLLVAPLHYENKPLGTLSLNSDAPDAFSLRDECLVTALAEHASEAVQRSQRYAAAWREIHCLGSILNNLSDGIVVLDGEGRVVRYNPALAHILGTEVSHIVGQKVAEDSEIEGLRRLAAMLGDAPKEARGKYERHIELEEPIHAILHIQVSPVLDQDGNWGQLIVLHDRTDELDRIRDKSGFIAVASRALRSPLESIRGYATLLMSRRLPDEPRVGEWACRIREQTVRLTRFAEDLADLCAVEPDGLTIETDLVSVEELLSDVINELDEAIQRKELSVKLRCPPELPDLPLDRDRVRHVLLNLLENAIHRSVSKGHIGLKVEASLEELTITLVDDGKPVPAETKAQVLRGIYRADGSFAQGPVGAGLGLYISRKIVEAHGGHLWMPENEEGQVRVQFILPLEAPAGSDLGA